MSDLRKLADRMEEFVTPRVARLTLPYLREKAAVGVGYGFVAVEPAGERGAADLTAGRECVASAEPAPPPARARPARGLVEIIDNREIWTAFQPIVEIETDRTVGHEGLSRGPAGQRPRVAHRPLRPRRPLRPGGGAGARLPPAGASWTGRPSARPGRLFLNTVPATVRDTSFLGRGVLDYLGPNLSPRLVTLEITERQVIENMNLYREAMHSFLDLGFTFAIDDLGAGYSGLETMATLGASYLKIDMGLVRDVHQKRVSQQVVKAIVEMGAGVGATVIAEGIETQEEARGAAGPGRALRPGLLLRPARRSLEDDLRPDPGAHLRWRPSGAA